MAIFGSRKTRQVDAASALPGRQQPMPVAERHVTLGTPLATAGYGTITTQIVPAGEFYFAEDRTT
jgi:peptide-methionine (S)-S-oxide reductase